MTPAEMRFKRVVRNCLLDGRYPGPVVVLRMLGQHATNLNGRQLRWRAEVLDPWMKEHPDHPITRKRARLRRL